MGYEPSEQERQPPSRSGWGAAVIVAAAVIGVAGNLLQPGSPWAIGLFAVALIALALFLRSDRDE